MNRVLAGMIAVGLVAATATARPTSAAEPSAVEIVAKNVAARGGLDAWRKVETMVWIGHVESAHAPAPSMAFELEQKRPNKTRLQLRALGEKSMRVFDGAHGWKLRPARGRPGAQPYTPQELKSAQAGHGIDGPLIDFAAKGNSVTLESVDEIGGRKAYHLKVRLAKGGNEDVWVDTETYLDVRYDRMAEGPGGGQRRVSAEYGDYRSVDGLLIPFLIRTGGGPGATPDRMQLETVVLNAPLDDSTFEDPTAARPRQRARPLVAPRALARTRPSTASTEAREAGGTAPQ
ncbi:MAG TPA: hypothetical protein VF834_07810 [Streptosporangiaceae bacterium]